MHQEQSADSSKQPALTTVRFPSLHEVLMWRVASVPGVEADSVRVSGIRFPG